MTVQGEFGTISKITYSKAITSCMVMVGVLMRNVSLTIVAVAMFALAIGYGNNLAVIEAPQGDLIGDWAVGWRRRFFEAYCFKRLR